MRFRQAAEATPGLGAAYRRGLQAVRAPDRRRITCRHPDSLAGSVNVDAALKHGRPDEPRWDYAIGVVPARGQDRIAWVEVHPASSANVTEVLDKLRWLKDWLQSTARQLDGFDRRFVWLASSGVAIPKGSPQYRRLAAAGLKFPRTHIVLEEVWGD